MEYLRHEGCALQVLLLNGADVDDDECGFLADAVMMNTSIISLSLTNNMIGLVVAVAEAITHCVDLYSV